MREIEVSGHKAVIVSIRGVLADDNFLRFWRGHDHIEVRLDFPEPVDAISGFIIEIDPAVLPQPLVDDAAVILLIREKAEARLAERLQDDKEAMEYAAQQILRCESLKATATVLKELLGV